MKRLMMIGILAASTSTGVAFADNALHVVWNKAPINVVLPVGQERMVSFPEPMKFGYNDGLLPPSTLRVENDDETLYLLAHKSFPVQRVEVLMPQTGDVILLNLSANKHASDTPLDVVLPETGNTQTSQQSSDSDSVVPQDVDNVSLIRWAVHQLYAPARLLTQPDYINRVPMGTLQSAPLILDNSMTASPRISWRANNSFVTAVMLYNNENFSQSVNPAQFCGNWEMVGVYPRRTLAPQNNVNDFTTVFLMSKAPFSQAISECEPSQME